MNNDNVTVMVVEKALLSRYVPRMRTHKLYGPWYLGDANIQKIHTLIRSAMVVHTDYDENDNLVEYVNTSVLYGALDDMRCFRPHIRGSDRGLSVLRNYIRDNSFEILF